ncbi:MAG: ribosome biogenesis GTP-binding protein YihA/YsxC [Pseudomonadota bacterium]
MSNDPMANDPPETAAPAAAAPNAVEGAATGDDETFSARKLEAARKLFAQPCTFLKGVVSVADLPAPDRVEVAFAGRSNVGKSSLLNALTNRTNLARTSNTPGRTQEINFFSLDEKVHLVDMPGYGYARTSRTRVEAWTQLIKDYLRGRVALRRVFLLIDARHGIKANDTEIMELLDAAAVTYQIVLTKTDKLRGRGVDTLLERTQTAIAKHPAAFPTPLLTSSEKKVGIAELRATIADLLT